MKVWRGKSWTVRMHAGRLELVPCRPARDGSRAPPGESQYVYVRISVLADRVDSYAGSADRSVRYQCNPPRLWEGSSRTQKTPRSSLMSLGPSSSPASRPA